MTTVYFVANSTDTKSFDFEVNELWKTDGTAAGTVLVKDIEPGPTGSSPHDLTLVNGTLFFAAFDDAHGDQLWKSDGTTAGTVPVMDLTPGFSGPDSDVPHAVFNGMFYFVANDGTSGTELWKTDGVTTTLVADISPGGAGSAPDQLTVVNGELYFTATDGTHGTELWKTDGTTAGTVMVADLSPAGESNPSHLTDVNGTLFFDAFDGTHGTHCGRATAPPPAPSWSRPTLARSNSSTSTARSISMPSMPSIARAIRSFGRAMALRPAP